MNKKLAIYKARTRSKLFRESFFVVRPRLCRFFAVCREADLAGLYARAEIVARFENGEKTIEESFSQ